LSSYHFEELIIVVTHREPLKVLGRPVAIEGLLSFRMLLASKLDFQSLEVRGLEYTKDDEWVVPKELKLLTVQDCI
jgi:hypothetical protein